MLKCLFEKSLSRIKLGSFITLKYIIRFQNTILCSFNKHSVVTTLSPSDSKILRSSLYKVTGGSIEMVVPTFPLTYSDTFSLYKVILGTNSPLHIGQVIVYFDLFLPKPDKISSSLNGWSHSAQVLQNSIPREFSIIQLSFELSCSFYSSVYLSVLFERPLSQSSAWSKIFSYSSSF